MKKTITLVLWLFTIIGVNSQTIYSKAYGDSDDTALIFLHGGPGYNSIAFELSSAKKLSDAGFYVIVYDRRGEGRSADENTTFTFESSYADIDMLYDRFNLTEATLIGHSFGGILGTYYAENRAEKVKSLVLVSSPLVMQDIFSTIIKTSKVIYQNNDDKANLGYIKMLENMDTKTLEYASYSFGHAMQNGFYTPKAPSNSALQIYKDLNNNAMYKTHGTTMTTEAPQGFWENENYTTIDLTQKLKGLLDNGIPIYGLYGKDDGLFSENHIMKLESIIPKNNFKYFKNSSHNVFIDQQKEFIKALKNWNH